MRPTGGPLTTLEITNDIGLVTLDNPPVGALSRALIQATRQALDAAVNGGARAVVVRSATPGFFGAGADLKLLASLDRATYRTYLSDVRACADQLAALPLVSIAAIDGLALGGGLELAIACTFRVAGPGARLGLPEIRLAMLPGSGGTQRLTHLVGRDAALDLVLSGRQIEPEEALKLGVVSRLSAGPADVDAIEWAGSFSRNAPVAIQAILRCIDAAVPYARPAGAATEERESRALFDTDEAHDAIRAFVEWRRRRTESDDG
jgi:enoyl-CoA hydratase